MSGYRSAPIVFVGAATLDAISVVDRFPEPNERLVADSVLYAGGGPAATAAVAAARLGVAAAFAGTVGDDDEGDRIIGGLRAEGVDVSAVRTVPGSPSQASVVLIDRSRGTRAICTREACPLDLGADPALLRLLEGAEWLHVDHHGWRTAQSLAAREGTARPRLSVDAGNPIPGFRARGVDLYVPTAEALEAVYGPLPIEELLVRALDDGADSVVATCGAAGAVAATHRHPVVRAPGLATDVVSTLGAGDVFHGALLAALVRQMPLPVCLRYANIAAALSCRGVDGRSAIPTHSEVMSAMDVHDH
ncbi:carbohydrate kinase family protein [Actinomadura sp. K4S16]|uniref:carbohydrate kinase family protein n=1 Tax=Actinomadura sp. K4S16 TaxID=1316147 RepID=UPI0011EE51B2|nr:PfkB family carbohydrate kinase [Actinomadura sp. K4S16]